MIAEEKKQRIRELRENLTIKEVAEALNVSESTVGRYSSDDYEKDNENDKKTANRISDIMLKEGYDFQDEIVPVVYKAKNIATELDITLHDYINDINNIMNKFLRITDAPDRFYYVFCQLANSLVVITPDHIETENIINAVDYWYSHAIAMENVEVYIKEVEAKADLILVNTKETFDDYQKRIKKAKRKLISEVESKSETLLRNSKQTLKENQKKISDTQKELDSINTARTLVIEDLEKIGTENQELKNLLEQINKENSLLKETFKKINQDVPTLLKEFERIKQENYLLKKSFMNKLNFQFFPKKNEH